MLENREKVFYRFKVHELESELAKLKFQNARLNDRILNGNDNSNNDHSSSSTISNSKKTLDMAFAEIF